MALIKQKELESGIVGSYWVAETHNNMQSHKTEILMLLYKDAEARQSGKAFIYRQRVKDADGVYLSGEQVYSAIKEIRLGSREVSSAIEEERDDDGNVTQEAVSAVNETVETNWFRDAQDA